MEQQKKTKNIKKIFLSSKNLKRDIVIISIAVFFSSWLTIKQYQAAVNKNQTGSELSSEIENVIKQEIKNEAEDPPIATANWKTYQNQQYGFELKYPNNWSSPLAKKGTDEVKWKYRYQFRKKEQIESNLYAGFDVVLYEVEKIKEIFNTDEFPTIKKEELRKLRACSGIDRHLGNNDNYPAEQVYIGPDDYCFNLAYFYTLTRNDYIYNIVPIFGGEERRKVEFEEEIIQNFPEFISVASTFNLIDIVRAKPIQPKPKIVAPKPLAETRTNAEGKMVCAKENDHPSKSSQGKGKHLDMECCLDPDEYPNPWCYYPREKYGKLLDKLNK